MDSKDVNEVCKIIKRYHLLAHNYSGLRDYVRDRLETVKGYGDYALHEAEIALLERILNREKQL